MLELVGTVSELLWQLHPRPTPPPPPPWYRRIFRPPPVPPKMPARLVPYGQDSHPRLVPARDFLKAVQVDLDPVKPACLRLDLSIYTSEKHRTSFEQKGSRQKAEFSQVWFEFKGPLADGRKLHVTVRLRVRTRFKLARRGYAKRQRYALVEQVRVGVTPAVSPPADQPQLPACFARATWRASGELELVTRLARLHTYKGRYLKDTKHELVDGTKLVAACLAFFASIARS